MVPTLPSHTIRPRSVFGQPGCALEVHGEGRLASRRAFYAALRDDPGFRRDFATALLAHGRPAAAWETAPISRTLADAPMSQSLLPHPALARAVADRTPFMEHLTDGEGRASVVSFLNFGGDATLIVPTAPSRDVDYAHLVPFLTNAPLEQQDALFREVGRCALEHLERSDAPLWISTAGLGVAWLHVRLDQRPKYYRSEALRVPR